MLLKRKYNKGYFVQHSSKPESKKATASKIYNKQAPSAETVSSEKVILVKADTKAEPITPALIHKSLVPSPEKTNTSAVAKSTSAQINKIKVAAQKRSQRKHPSGCFNNGGIDDVTGPLAVIVFILLTILYAVAIMSQSPGANWVVAIALGALFAAITLVTGVSCM